MPSIGVPREASKSVSRLRASRESDSTIAGSSLGPSTPWFQLLLLSVPSRLFSPLASLCLRSYETRSWSVKPSWTTTKLTPVDGAGALGNRSGEPAIRLGTRPASPRIAAPEAARGVAKAVVPVSERGTELAEAIAARADVPRLGDEARLGENGIGGKRFEERRLGGEAGVAATESRGKIEAKAIEPAIDHPALERANRHFNDQWTVERKAIPGAGIVDVEFRIVGIQTEPGLIVEAPERQRRP